MSIKAIDSNVWLDQKWRRNLKDIKLRYLWFYLLSCPNSKSCGVFYLPLDQITYDTKLDEEETEKFLKVLEDNDLCKYNQATEEIAIYNFPKYNIRNTGKPIIDMLNRELSAVKEKSLVNAVFEKLCQYKNNTKEQSKFLHYETLTNIYKNYCKGGDIVGELNNTNTNTYTNTDTPHDSCTDSLSDTEKIIDLDEMFKE